MSSSSDHSYGKNIVILTGAGLSAESGLSTFRDNNGLWCEHRIEDVATPEAYARDPELVQSFYNTRRTQLKEVQPNAAHYALAELSRNWMGSLLLVTQNVDDLLERAGAGDSLVHMHGELKKARCVASERVFFWEQDITPGTHCPCCDKPNRLRPHIVWFGEMPLHMDLIYRMLSTCDLFISIGTSGNVYPAAGFVREARNNGKAHTVEINMEPSLGHSSFHEHIYGPATQTVPQYIQQIMGKVAQTTT